MSIAFDTSSDFGKPHPALFDLVVDVAVNMGSGAATRMLQKALGEAYRSRVWAELTRVQARGFEQVFARAAGQFVTPAPRAQVGAYGSTTKRREKRFPLHSRR